MAKLSREDVLKLAQLARLKLTEVEVEQFQKELSAILAYVEQLNTVDTTGLEPTYQVTGLTNVMRADVEKELPGVTSSELLRNAPQTQDGHIKVKRMVG